jgi:hypothetical protein
MKQPIFVETPSSHFLEQAFITEFLEPLFYNFQPCRHLLIQYFYQYNALSVSLRLWLIPLRNHR